MDRSSTTPERSTVIIRPISEDELDDFLPLTVAYRDWYRAVPVSYVQNADFFRRFLEPSDHGLWLGAKVNDKPIGFATLYWIHSSLAATDMALLNDLYVDPEHRGAGAGQALLDAAVCAAQSRRLSRLDWYTSPDNATAQRLYDRTGADRSEWIEYSLALSNEQWSLGR